jgi:hypothetical protein
MPHNIRQEKLRRTLMSSPLEGWRGWQVCASEQGGRHAGAIWVALLLDRPDPVRTVGHMVAALRCQLCGAAPATVALRRRTETEDTYQPVIGNGAHDLRQGTVPRGNGGQASLPSEQPPAMGCETVRVEWWHGMKV